MKSKLTLIWFLALGLAFNPVAFADDDDDMDDDDTMTMVDEDEGEADVVEFVELPVPNENATFGIGVANAARDPENTLEGREFGEWVAEQVRADAEVQGSDNAAAAADRRAEAAIDAADNSRRASREDNPGRGQPRN